MVTGMGKSISLSYITKKDFFFWQEAITLQKSETETAFFLSF